MNNFSFFRKSRMVYQFKNRRTREAVDEKFALDISKRKKVNSNHSKLIQQQQQILKELQKNADSNIKKGK